MNDEIASYIGSLDGRWRLLTRAVEGLTAAQLNYRPDFEGANSAWVLAEHILGNARAWIIGIACGVGMRRDRAAEFASTGADAGSLEAMIERTRADINAALGAMDPARLSFVQLPPQDLFGEGPARETSSRAAIVQVIEHASLHIGHLEIVRALALTHARST